MNEKALVVLSGGLDSTILLHFVKKQLGCKEIYAITFDYGQRIIREVECAKYQARQVEVKEHKIIKMDFFKDISTRSAMTNLDIAMPKAREDIGNAQPVSYVPFRNLLLLTTTAAWAETLNVKDVFYGAVKTDDYSGYWDCTSMFREQINRLYNLNRKHQVTIHAPFVDKEKDEIVKIGVDLQVNFNHTHTCYEGGSIGCGECVSCAARIQSFITNNIIDPIPYKKDIPWSKFNCRGI